MQFVQVAIFCPASTNGSLVVVRFWPAYRNLFLYRWLIPTHLEIVDFYTGLALCEGAMGAAVLGP